jgi:hypothetical protein
MKTLHLSPVLGIQPETLGELGLADAGKAVMCIGIEPANRWRSIDEVAEFHVWVD